MPLSSISPLVPASSTRVEVKSVTRMLPNAALPSEPLNTLDASVASAINTNSRALSSIPKNAVLAAPSLYRAVIPRSRPSLLSCPSWNSGSAIVTTVLSTVVVVPVTFKLPAIVTVPPAPAVDGSMVISE